MPAGKASAAKNRPRSYGSLFALSDKMNEHLLQVKNLVKSFPLKKRGSLKRLSTSGRSMGLAST